jgi:Tol biopolymer transport system component
MTASQRIAIAALCAAAAWAQQSSPALVFSGRVYGRGGTLYRQLWRLTGPGGRRVQLSRSTRHHDLPGCGTDGRTLLFLSGGDQQAHELWTFDTNTRAERMLLKTDEDQPISRLLGWSRGGREVVLALDTVSGSHLAKLLLPEKTLVGLPRAENPALSPDGTRIAYDTSYLGGGSLAQSQLLVVDLDGKPVAHLGRGARPTWSPDSEKLVALVANGTDLQIVEVRSRAIERTVALPAKSDRWTLPGALTWSPDGKWILASSPAEGAEEYWLLNMETRMWTYLDRGRGARWSPDGTRLVYATPWRTVKVDRKDVPVSTLRMAEAPDFRAQELAFAPAAFDSPAWCALDFRPPR